MNMRAVLMVACLVVGCSAQMTEALQCAQHEVASCVKACPPEKTCRNRGIAFSCLYDSRLCTPKCICAEGYYRNAIGECITGAECDQCQKPNEFYSCNSACDNECEKIATQNRTNCPIQNIKCNEWCYCDDGYARDKQKNCVPVSKCPKAVPVTYGRQFRADMQYSLCTGPNEVFTCKTDCPPETCLSLVVRVKCDSKVACRPRCACKPGYLRVSNGSPCVPICQCPEMANSADCFVKLKYESK